jgi:hypothetical protein
MAILETKKNLRTIDPTNAKNTIATRYRMMRQGLSILKRCEMNGEPESFKISVIYASESLKEAVKNTDCGKEIVREVALVENLRTEL